MILRLALFYRRFRWAELQVNSLCEQEYIHCAEDVEEALYSFPETLQAIYQESLQIFSHYKAMSKKVIEGVLKLLLCAEKPLLTSELLGAVALNQHGHTMTFDAMDVVRMSRGLIVLDQSTKILRFAQLSVRGFLETHPDYCGEMLHSLAAQICITHLLEKALFLNPVHSKYADKSTKLAPSDAQTDQFYDYAISYWARYCQKAGSQRSSGQLKVYLRKLLSDVEVDKSPFKQWIKEIRTKCFYYFEHDRQLHKEHSHSHSWPANELFVACTYNFIEIVDLLLKSSSDVLDCRNALGMNGLEISAYHGHYQLTQELFFRAKISRSPQIWGSNFLTRAASGCADAKVIEFLLCELPEVRVSTATLLAAVENERFSSEVLRCF